MRKTKPENPINEFLKKNKKKHPVSFHMPGHKYRGGGIRSFDITEIPGADNIKKPEGIIKKSLSIVSKTYKTKRSFYLTNGTSQGVHAIMRYASLKGGSLIVSRDCHISVINGAAMYGVDLVFASAGIGNGIPVPVSLADIRTAVESNPKACGLLITSPNYYGRVADITHITEEAHNAGMFLAVDEAHGAHFEFAGLGNISGITNGADIVCHSLHKTLPVYNQGALLHVCSDRIDEKLLSEAVNMTGTTSPSYPLMASMEKAVTDYNIGSRGCSYGKIAKSINFLKTHLKYQVVENDDFTRLVICVPGNGFQAAGLLHENNIDTEAADFNHIICIATPNNNKRDFIRLMKVLNSMKPDSTKTLEMPHMLIPEKVLSVTEAYGMACKPVALNMAEGCICGTIIVSYPPGTPVLCPGEIIDGFAVDYIKKIMDSGGTVLGMENNNLPVLEQT